MKTRSFVFLLTVALFAMVPVAYADGGGCHDVAGVLMTDIGAITPGSINLGPAFGDLAGAVSAQILNGGQPDAQGNFHVQHYWVSAQGDIIKFQQAVLHPVYLTGMPGVVAVPWNHYKAFIIPGGTGKWAKATGWIDCFGMADFNQLTLVLRYRGEVCSNQ